MDPAAEDRRAGEIKRDRARARRPREGARRAVRPPARGGQAADSAQPGAGSVVRIAARRLARGEVLAPDAAAPLYLRDKVALTTTERQALS